MESWASARNPLLVLSGAPNGAGIAQTLPIDPWRVGGPVVKGFGRGSKVLGIPTGQYGARPSALCFFLPRPCLRLSSSTSCSHVPQTNSGMPILPSSRSHCDSPARLPLESVPLMLLSGALVLTLLVAVLGLQPIFPRSQFQATWQSTSVVSIWVGLPWPREGSSKWS